MSNEVKISMEPNRYESLKAILRFQANKITLLQLKAVLIGLGYPAKVVEDDLTGEIEHIAEQCLKAIS